MLLLGCLLVLFSTVPVESSPTKFHITGDFFCEFDWAKNEEYILDVKVMEQDFWFFVWFDDDIGIPGSLNMTRYPSNAKEVNQKSITYSIEAEDDGDGPGLEYEVYLSVQHNCHVRRKVEWKNWDVVHLGKAKEHWLKQTVIVTDLNSKKRSTDDKRSECSPTDPRTILFAYSTDLDYSNIEFGFNRMLYYTKIQNLWRTYANIRFDTRIEEQIAYHYDFPSFNASVLSHKPDPSLGYQDSTTGSDVFKVIKKFLETSPSLCGSSIFIVPKRYPNDAPQLEGLISELRNNHIFVYIIADSEPSGGTNSAALFEISSKTNGFCIFGPDSYTSYEIYISSIAFITRPYQVASKNVRVSGSGSQTLSVTVYGADPTQQLGMIITFLGHPRDGSIKALNYTLTDSNGEVNTSGPFQSVLQRNDTLCYEFPVVNNTIEYTLTVNYEYEKDREGYLEMRFYSADYKIGYWLPFDN